MKEITIANQPWLSFGRTVKITVDGIKYRLFRASVTVAVITLAVAFLMNILAESLIKRSVASNTRERIRTSRIIYDWSAKLSSPGSPEALINEIAAASPDSDRYRETQRFAALDDDKMANFQAETRKIVFVLNFFNNLDYAKRRSMIHTAQGLDILKQLSTPEGMEKFKSALANIKSVHFEMADDELKALLRDYAAINATVNTILKARTGAIAKVTKALKGSTLIDALRDADSDFGDTIRQAGFILDPKTVAPEIAAQAMKLHDTLRLEKSMEVLISKTTTTENGTKDANGNPVKKTEKVKEYPLRQFIAQHANVLPADVNVVMMWKYMANKKFAANYLARMKKISALADKYLVKGKPGTNAATDDAPISIEGVSAEQISVNGLSTERVVSLARERTELASLIKAERLTADAGKGFMGLGERLAWLLFVSMLVCGIGITNAMMMSVTERFTEIATLKCLGALDGFIMLMFVLESCFMGVIGGLIGAFLGGVIGLGRMMVSFGVNFFSAIPVFDLILGMLASILLGTILAAIAAVIPSYKAARLAPMEAMRVE